MTDPLSNKEKMTVILDYWLEHNREHLRENAKWHAQSLEMGYPDIAGEFERIGRIMDEAVHHMELHRDILDSGVERHRLAPASAAKSAHTGKRREEARAGHVHAQHGNDTVHRHIQLHQIGIIRTPYPPGATREEMQEEGECRIVVNDRFKDGLRELDRFRYIIVLFYLDRVSETVSLQARPPSAQGRTVGVFASRSPNRPNPVGLCITELKGIEGNEVITGRIDAYDTTPLIDIKPYFEEHDSIFGAGNGWLDDFSR
jgi:tRNA-Thr(GGU) m(6)t(6)A37 methyltransferase TsaA